MTTPLINKLGRFMELTSEEERILEGAVRRRATIKKGVDIISEGQKPDEVRLIAEGWACRYKRLENGEQHIMAYLIPGDICDLYTSILDQMDHSIRSLTPLKVIIFSPDEPSNLMEHNLRLARALIWSSLVDEAILREWLVNAGTRTADKRLAHLFCELLLRSRAAGLTQDNSFELPLTQAELGESMGITHVHINRVLRKLHRGNLIYLENKRMFILDWERLKEYTQFNPNYLHYQLDPSKVPPT
ncbi:Crp/Fnr family transcriptional regulator [Halomonas korlensis]|uniref:cAMP-binding domain of CRP or a regulatory subunit of cAMP-dependent protein kinases n=1 Tax=Halomonas korlensis TaxID=463301 RepID=A0A1I7FKC2_9GAMM|nr:Crp/Fnr family transcriptional regulator [Halomonas korlensis]SFU36496.1 cAMP-binding domain of CRP or a regulatory subunit of cAMP-dependent protein kinases [Halomonas korlensis]